MTLPSHLDSIADLLDGFDARAMAAFRQVSTHIKADGTPVTRVDQETTEAVQTALRKRFPNYGILSEENPEDYLPDAEWQWVLDPLDGTAMFARGFPVWGIGLGLMRGQTPVEGGHHLGQLLRLAGRPARLPGTGEVRRFYRARQRYSEDPGGGVSPDSGPPNGGGRERSSSGSSLGRGTGPANHRSAGRVWSPQGANGLVGRPGASRDAGFTRSSFVLDNRSRLNL